jgi:hypothetical protein
MHDSPKGAAAVEKLKANFGNLPAGDLRSWELRKHRRSTAPFSRQIFDTSHAMALSPRDFRSIASDGTEAANDGLRFSANCLIESFC